MFRTWSQKRILGLIAALVGLVAGILILITATAGQGVSLLTAVVGLGVLYGSYLIYRGKTSLLFGWGKARLGAWINLILGAGLYAGPKGAVSVTGIGEEIMKRVLSKFVYDRIADGMTPQRAADRGLALFPKDVPIGVIALDRRGWGESCNRSMAWFVSERRRTL